MPDVARVSWLVPVYNAAPYLEHSLQSIRDQTYTDFDVIVVDDGSTDRSWDIIQRFCAADSRFCSVAKPNSGIIDALNLGLSHCTGDYVARMDGDDICEPRRLEVQVRFMDSHPGCVVAGSRIVVIDEKGRTLRNAASTVWKRPGPTGFPPRSVTLTHPTILVRTAVIREVGGYRHGFFAAEDYDLLFRLARKGELVELSERLLHYRVHSRSESATKIGHQRLSSLKAEISDYLSDRPIDRAQVKRILDSATMDELCDAAGRAGHGLPDAAVLRTYYLAEYLRRATYRLSNAEALGVAAQTARQVTRMTPRLRSATARYFILKAVRELMRWAAITASGRNGRSGRSAGLIRAS